MVYKNLLYVLLDVKVCKFVFSIKNYENFVQRYDFFLTFANISTKKVQKSALFL